MTTTRQVFCAYDENTTAASSGCCFCPRCGAACVANGARRGKRVECPECQLVQYRNPAPGVAVVVTQDSCVLLGRRAPGAVFGGQWAFPAGFIQFDEDFLSAARRETREETGLEVEVTGILSVSSNFLSAALHALVVAVAARPVGGTLRAGDDLCDLCWVLVTGPYPPLAYEADAHLLRGMARGSLPVLPVDRRYATTPRLRRYTP